MTLIDRAIETAFRAHKNQVRKGTDIPYVTHPVAVGIMLARAGCGEEVIAAGILHDSMEDTGMSLGEIREEFGERVASIVEGVSERDKSLPWEVRKAHTIESLKTAPLEVRLVACADKLHNVRTIARDYGKLGEQVWQRFNRGKEQQAWYYREIVKALCTGSDAVDSAPLFQELKKEVEKLFG